jgi:anaphase-promoting complex subunit 10
VSILSIRIYLDFLADESYTPTRITLLAGTGYHDLIPFSELSFDKPAGWIDVPLEHVGGGRDGRTLRAFLVQVRIMENHQNGKDTHVRGLKVFARDEKLNGGDGLSDGTDLISEKRKLALRVLEVQEANDSPSIGLTIPDRWLEEPDWMGEPVLR